MIVGPTSGYFIWGVRGLKVCHGSRWVSQGLSPRYINISKGIVMIIENSDISILEGYGKGGYGSSCILIWEDDVWGDRQ